MNRVMNTHEHTSWWTACSKCCVLTMARILPELLAAQYGVTTSTVDSHASNLSVWNEILTFDGPSMKFYWLVGVGVVVLAIGLATCAVTTTHRVEDGGVVRVQVVEEEFAVPQVRHAVHRRRWGVDLPLDGPAAGRRPAARCPTGRCRSRCFAEFAVHPPDQGLVLVNKPFDRITANFSKMIYLVLNWNFSEITTQVPPVGLNLFASCSFRTKKVSRPVAVQGMPSRASLHSARVKWN